MKSFKCAEMAQLGRELKMAPARLRLRHISGILHAIHLLDPKKEYPFELISYHVTGYQSKRARTVSDLPTLGKTLIEDLVGLAESLTQDRPLPADVLPEAMFDTDTLSGRFGVSTKTISRWRKRGLVGVWCFRGEERPRLMFSSRSIRAFGGRNMELIKRGSSFKVMHDSEREQLLKRAREIVAAGETTLHAVTQKLSEESGRAIETIRYTLRNFDRDHPEQALFDKTEQAQPVEWCDVVYRAFMDGESMEALAKRWDIDVGKIGEAITQGRLNELREGPLDYIHCDAFDTKDADERFLSEELNEITSDEIDDEQIPDGLPAYMEALYRTPLLSAEQERTLFLRMNYRMHRAEMLRLKLVEPNDESLTSAIAAVDAEIDLANRIRKQIAQANLRLVVSIAKRHLATNRDRTLFELVSDGNVALMRSVDKFDVMRGFKFSTYATWSIKRAYARSLPQEQTQRDRFRTGHDEFLSSIRDHRAEVYSMDPAPQVVVRESLVAGLAALDERERAIVERRFGLIGDGPGESLEDISRDLKISIERVRQIEMKALGKLRGQIDNEVLQRAG